MRRHLAASPLTFRALIRRVVPIALAWGALASPAFATTIAAGAPSATVPASLVDPLGSLSLAADEFLVPVSASHADALDLWSFTLHFDAAVATPVDLGGLYQGVYQADFGGGAISQITGSGFLLPGVLEDVSGWFAPAVDGNGVLAWVVFEYLPGQQGNDPGVWAGDMPPTQVLPEPSGLQLMLAAAVLGALVARSRRPAHPRLQRT